MRIGEGGDGENKKGRGGRRSPWNGEGAEKAGRGERGMAARPTRHESLSPFRGFNVGTNFASPFLRRAVLSTPGSLVFHRRPPSWVAPLSTPILAHIFQSLAALQIRPRIARLAVIPIERARRKPCQRDTD